MRPTLYFPYEELRITQESGSGLLNLKTPWLELQVAAKTMPAPQLEILMKSINNQSVTQREVYPLVRKFLSHFHDHPVWYCLPTIEGLAKRDKLENPPNIFLFEARSAREVKEVLDPKLDVPPPHWSEPWKWDWDSTWSFAELAEAKGFADPRTLLTCFRRYHLLNVVNVAAVDPLIVEMERVDLADERLLSLAALFVKQNHFVTVSCIQVMQLALDLFPERSEVLESFIDSEKGHDKLLQQSLNSLGYQIDDLPLLPEVNLVMKLFEEAARTNSLAFATMIDFFEMGSGAPIHPVARILQSKGYGEAARGLQAHREINMKGHHAQIAFEILGSSTPVSQEEALVAAKICETASIIFSRWGTAILYAG